MALLTLKTRAEFLRVRGGSRCATRAFVLETRPRIVATVAGETAAVPEPRFGFTITKKIGNAVVRNRIRRRLKAAIAGMLPTAARQSHDYVVIARGAAFDIPFATLQKDLEHAMQRVHHAGGVRSPEGPSKATSR